MDTNKMPAVIHAASGFCSGSGDHYMDGCPHEGQVWEFDEIAHPGRRLPCISTPYVRADLVREAMEALEEALEYFDNKSDADHDETGFVPNTEMTMASIVDAALSKLKEAGL